MHSEVRTNYRLCSLFKEQLMRKQQHAGIISSRAILQLRKLKAAASGDKVSSRNQEEKRIHKLSRAGLSWLPSKYWGATWVVLSGGKETAAFPDAHTVRAPASITP